jgi:hypothetical protein
MGQYIRSVANTIALSVNRRSHRARYYSVCCWDNNSSFLVVSIHKQQTRSKKQEESAKYQRFGVVL